MAMTKRKQVELAQDSAARLVRRLRKMNRVAVKGRDAPVFDEKQYKALEIELARRLVRPRRHLVTEPPRQKRKHQAT